MASTFARALPTFFGLALLPACSSPTPREVTPWAQSFDAAGQVQVLGAAVDPFSGGVALTGTFSGSIDLGGGKFESSFGSDLFVMEIDDVGRSSWGGHTGAASFQGSQGVAIAGNGDVITAGTFANAVSFGGPTLTTKSQSSYVARFDASGGLLWNQKLGDDLSVVAVSGVALDREGNIVIAGSFSGNVALGGAALVSPGQSTFVAKLDGDGNPIFGRQFDGSGHSALAIGVDTFGNSVVFGRNQGDLYIGDQLYVANGTEAFLAKLDRNGGDLWSLEITGDVGYLAPGGLAVDAAGAVVVAGTFAQSLNVGPFQASTENYTAAGFAAKFSTGGTPLWLHTFAGDGSNGTSANAVALDGGHIFVTGAYSGAADFGSGPLPTELASISSYLCELDGAGTALTTRTFDTPDTTYSTGQTLATDPEGGVILTGTYAGTMVFDGTTIGTGTSGNGLYVARMKTPLASP